MLKLSHLQRTKRRDIQQGLSIVEMMVGMTIGLLVVAAASMVVTTQLKENRKLLIEVQIQQDLRSAADIITRELRRAGAWTAAQTGVWTTINPAPQPNTFTAVTLDTPTSTHIAYRYKRIPGDTGGPYGFKLENGSIKSLLGGTWQELTDSRTLRVTSFEVSPVTTGEAIQLPCPKLCADGSTDCWPSFSVRELEVAITGQAVSDASVTRSVRTKVRLRNDLLQFNDAANPTRVCPL